MAFVIVSAGHLTDSRLRTLRARPVLVAVLAVVAVLMLACAALGFRLGQLTAPAVAAAPPDGPEIDAMVNRVGDLSGRVARLEREAAGLAARLGTPVVAATLASDPRTEPAGGPFVTGDGLARLEADTVRIEGTIDDLSHAAIEQELASMAFPSRLPVAGSRVPVSSHFGTRHDPFTGRLARHTGLDIPARHGTPILASGGGRVVTAGYKGAYGNAVIIDHGDGLATLYGHASRLLVKAGDIVLPNQKIALVGSTGRSTGAHLHFEVIRAGRRVEPREYLARVLDRSAEPDSQ